MKLRLHTDGTIEHGNWRIGGETEEVFDARSIDIHGESNVMPDAVQSPIITRFENAHHLPAGGEVRAIHGGIH